MHEMAKVSFEANNPCKRMDCCMFLSTSTASLAGATNVQRSQVACPLFLLAHAGEGLQPCREQLIKGAAPSAGQGQTVQRSARTGSPVLPAHPEPCSTCQETGDIPRLVCRGNQQDVQDNKY